MERGRGIGSARGIGPGSRGFRRALLEKSLSSSSLLSTRSEEILEKETKIDIEIEMKHEHISSNCQAIVKKENPKCGHLVDVKCSTDIFPPCSVIVVPRLPAYCGHNVKLVCSLNYDVPNSKLHFYCNEICNYKLACGHLCTGSCDSCRMGQLHIRCKKVCNKVLFCGHKCLAPCHEVCPPCWESCEESCFHQKCPYPCGTPCKKCKFPCIASCEHSKCTKLCGEICDRKEPCSRPCKMDGCVGLCEEPCPDLALNGKEKLIEGLLSSKFKLNESDRFVYLPNCKHTILVDTMDKWVETSAQNNEIVQKTCPICRATIGNHPRYQKHINKYKAELNKVKANIIGDIEMVGKIQYQTLKRIGQIPQNKSKFAEFRFFILAQLLISPEFSGGKASRNNLLPMDLARAKSVDYVSQIWKNIEEEATIFEPTLETPDYLVIRQEIIYIIGLIMDIPIPFTVQEYVDIDRELTRFADICHLYTRRNREVNPRAYNLSNYGKPKQFFDKTSEFVFRVGAYVEERQSKYNEMIKDLDEILEIELPISEEERQDILKGLKETGTGGVGRWFKCENGHYYVITECGGPTQLAKCPECGLVIGGEQHRIAKGNYLAPEMDGAKGPLYPTVFDPNPELF